MTSLRKVLADLRDRSLYEEEGQEEKQVDVKLGLRERLLKWLRSESHMISSSMFYLLICGCAPALLIQLKGFELMEFAINTISSPGKLFLRLLRVLLVPIVLNTLLLTPYRIEKMPTKKGLWRVGLYSMLSVLIGSIISIGIMIAINAGNGVKASLEAASIRPKTKNECSFNDVLHDLLVNFMPSNIIRAMTSIQMTCIDLKDKYEESLDKERAKGISYYQQPSMIALAPIALISGYYLIKLGEAGQNLLQIIKTLDVIFFKMSLLIMWYAPVAMYFVISCDILYVRKFTIVMQCMSLFLVGYCLSLIGYIVFFLFPFYLIRMRQNPFIYFFNTIKVGFTAFTLQSSIATLPLSFETLEDNFKFNKQFTRWYLPMSAIFHKVGAVIYVSSAGIFMMQFHSESITFLKLLEVLFLSNLLSFLSVASPNINILNTMWLTIMLRLPTDAMFLIVGIDWLIDRLSSFLNTMGDLFLAYVLEKELTLFWREVRPVGVGLQRGPASNQDYASFHVL